MEKGKIFVSAIVVAAGGATRMGMNKMLLELGSKTVFERSVEVFEDCPAIDEIVIVSSEENMARYRAIVRDGLFSKVTSIIRGGKTRQESVRLGLGACSVDADVVVIHDGARPLIKADTVTETVKAALEYGAAAVAIKSRDTIKHIDDEGFAVGTIDRETSMLIQTPQAFRRDIIVQAHEKAAAQGVTATDDCGLIERMGLRSKLIVISYFNIKLTVPDDMSLAKAILISRGKL